MDTHDSPAPPLTDAEWPAAIADLRDGFAGRLNVYRVMAHNPELLAAWRDFRNHVVLGSALTPVQSEIVILRTGHRHGSSYEWAQHVVRGLAAGLDLARIASVLDPATATPDDALLIRAVDALHDSGRLDAGLRAELIDRFGLKATIDVIATVGMYTTLAFLIETFHVPLEADVATAFAAIPL